MSKPIITILVGPSGAGKSTWAKAMETLGNVRINQDDQGKVGHMTAFNVAIFEGKNIVVDRLNFSKEQRNRYLIPAKAAGYKTQIIVFHVPFATCFDRCMARENHPTISTKESASSALNMFFKSYERVADDEADVVERLGWEGRKELCIYSDLDGTLCNIDHRIHHTKKTPEHPKADWKSFFNEMDKDLPNKFCVDIIKAILAKASNTTPEDRPCKLIFATGRPDNYRKQTTDWLLKTFGYQNYDYLFMRPRNDFRKDSIAKEIMLEFEIFPRYDILFALDDRDQVVKMLRSHRVRVLQVDYGDF